MKIESTRTRIESTRTRGEAQVETPMSYARRIAYLRDPRKVHSYTLAAIGAAPSLAVCEAIVSAHTAPERKFRELAQRRGMQA